MPASRAGAARSGRARTRTAVLLGLTVRDLDRQTLDRCDSAAADPRAC